MSGAEARTILIVEDEAATRTLIAHYLSANGLRVLEAADAGTFRRLIQRERIDLVLMDVRLPDGDGLDLARELRQRSDAGLIFVTSVDGEIDRVLGLELGADDYVTKPVAPRELLARIRSTLRRVVETPRRGDGQLPIRWLGPWQVDLTRREAVRRDGTRATLTRAEFDLLAALVEADGRPLVREFLLDVVSRHSEDVTDRTVDTLIGRLRRKIEADPGDPRLILTERGVGYRVART